jgi:uncharacterized small protein (DUF1192 family)
VRRRIDVVEVATSWVRQNLGIAATLVALAGTILGGVAAASTWLASVHHLERRVDVLRAEVNAMRATMDQNRVIVADVRRALEANDASAKEGIARLEERIIAVKRQP